MHIGLPTFGAYFRQRLRKMCTRRNNQYRTALRAHNSPYPSFPTKGQTSHPPEPEPHQSQSNVVTIDLGHTQPQSTSWVRKQTLKQNTQQSRSHNRNTKLHSLLCSLRRRRVRARNEGSLETWGGTRSSGARKTEYAMLLFLATQSIQIPTVSDLFLRFGEPFVIGSRSSSYACRLLISYLSS